MSGTALGAFGVNLAATAGISLAMFLIAFVVGVRTERHRYVDLAWGLAFAALAVSSTFLSSGHGDLGRRLLITILTVIWGVRLSAYLAWRSRGAPEDPRYEAMLARAGGSRALYAVTHIYLTQAVAAWVISIPMQIGQYGTRPLSWWAVVGGVVWLAGFGFESIGDYQLARFKADPANRGQLLTSGLWRYTRHPNYFGDACVWWGLFFLAADQPAAWPTIVCPAFMTWLLARGTGKPLTERHLAATRPDYAAYVRRTSGFLPRRPRG